MYFFAKHSFAFERAQTKQLNTPPISVLFSSYAKNSLAAFLISTKKREATAL